MSNSPVWDEEKDSEGRVIVDNSSDDMVFTKKTMDREKIIEQQLIETEIAKADAKAKCGHEPRIPRRHRKGLRPQLRRAPE